MVDAGNRIGTALDLGALVGQVSFEESVNKTTDTDDFYRVTLDRSGRINAVLSGTGGAVDLIADFTAGQDAIALINGLTFAGIALDASGSDTAIREVSTGQIIGVVTGVQPAALSAGNFATLPGDF